MSTRQVMRIKKIINLLISKAVNLLEKECMAVSQENQHSDHGSERVKMCFYLPCTVLFCYIDLTVFYNKRLFSVFVVD